MTTRQDNEDSVNPTPEQHPGSDPASSLDQLLERERQRSGPGSAARRTLEALDDVRRLSDDLADFDDYEI